MMARIKMQFAQHVGSDLRHDGKTDDVGCFQYVLIAFAYLHSLIESGKRRCGLRIAGRQRNALERKVEPKQSGNDCLRDGAGPDESKSHGVSHSVEVRQRQTPSRPESQHPGVTGRGSRSSGVALVQL